MQSLEDNGPVQNGNENRSLEETADVAILLLKGLNPLQEKSDMEGFGFLSYLLRMAILETQAIASGSPAESDQPNCDTGDSTFDAGSPGGVGSPFFERRC